MRSKLLLVLQPQKMETFERYLPKNSVTVNEATATVLICGSIDVGIEKPVRLKSEESASCHRRREPIFTPCACERCVTDLRAMSQT